MSFTNIVFCNVLNLRVSCPDEILIFSHGNGPDFRCRNRRHSFGQFPSVFHSNCESLSISSVVRSLSLSLTGVFLIPAQIIGLSIGISFWSSWFSCFPVVSERVWLCSGCKVICKRIAYCLRIKECERLANLRINCVSESKSRGISK